MADSPPAPKSILRGHKAQVHAAAFIRNNERLVTGDANGFVIIWDLTIMRPRAVWRAHENAILGVRGWGLDKIITHGRDHKLIVWKLGAQDEQRLSVFLPLEGDELEHRPQPWVLHILEVNTMNFCSFASCPRKPDEGLIDIDSASQVLLAVPNTLASEAIDVYALPEQARIYTIKPGQTNGMAMGLLLFHHEGKLTVIGAFENGFASVHRLEADGSWMMTYRCQAHTQPILSLDVGPGCEYFLTSSADAIIAKHPIPVSRQTVPTGPDPNQRVIEVETSTGSSSSSDDLQQSRETSQKEWEHPLKTINTKHSGQQDLHVRSDGKIFATAGWDTKIRVYSTKSLKELAVLAWHKVGVYAVAFSKVQVSASATAAEGSAGSNDKTPDAQVLIPPETTSQVSMAGGVRSVKDRRITYAKTAHWIAAGAKDGNVSLWDIY